MNKFDQIKTHYVFFFLISLLTCRTFIMNEPQFTHWCGKPPVPLTFWSLPSLALF